MAGTAVIVDTMRHWPNEYYGKGPPHQCGLDGWTQEGVNEVSSTGEFRIRVHEWGTRRRL